VNEDFSWVKKEQIKTVQITSTEESDRKEFEEFFEYDSNGALVRYELTEGWFKYIKEFNNQGFIKLEAELVRFDGEPFFDTADVTYFKYDYERIKRENRREFAAMKGDMEEKLSSESIRTWYYEPEVTIIEYYYYDYIRGSIESSKIIDFFNIKGLDSLNYYILDNEDTLYTRKFEYEYDKHGRKLKTIEKDISKDRMSVTQSTFKYRGQSKKLRLEKVVTYDSDNLSKISTTIYKYSLNGNIKFNDKSGEKLRNKRKPSKPEYDLKSRLKKARKTGEIVTIIYH